MNFRNIFCEIGSFEIMHIPYSNPDANGEPIYVESDDQDPSRYTFYHSPFFRSEKDSPFFHKKVDDRKLFTIETAIFTRTATNKSELSSGYLVRLEDNPFSFLNTDNVIRIVGETYLDGPFRLYEGEINHSDYILSEFENGIDLSGLIDFAIKLNAKNTIKSARS